MLDPRCSSRNKVEAPSEMKSGKKQKTRTKDDDTQSEEEKRSRGKLELASELVGSQSVFLSFFTFNGCCSISPHISTGIAIRPRAVAQLVRIGEDRQTCGRNDGLASQNNMES